MDMSIVESEQALRRRPHLAFVIECLGLATLVDQSTERELLTRLDHCLKGLAENCDADDAVPAAGDTPLAVWLCRAAQEFSTLPKEEFSLLMHACVGNTMPEWLKEMVLTELGDAVSELIRECQEC